MGCGILMAVTVKVLFGMCCCIVRSGVKSQLCNHTLFCNNMSSHVCTVLHLLLSVSDEYVLSSHVVFSRTLI